MKNYIVNNKLFISSIIIVAISIILMRQFQLWSGIQWWVITWMMVLVYMHYRRDNNRRRRYSWWYHLMIAMEITVIVLVIVMRLQNIKSRDIGSVVLISHCIHLWTVMMVHMLILYIAMAHLLMLYRKIIQEFICI